MFNESVGAKFTRNRSFFHGFQSRPLDPKDFCMEATGTPRQSVGFPGATSPLLVPVQLQREMPQLQQTEIPHPDHCTYLFLYISSTRRSVSRYPQLPNYCTSSKLLSAFKTSTYTSVRHLAAAAVVYQPLRMRLKGHSRQNKTTCDHGFDS